MDDARRGMGGSPEMAIEFQEGERGRALAERLDGRLRLTKRGILVFSFGRAGR
jgi:hypothetical protein